MIQVGVRRMDGVRADAGGDRGAHAAASVELRRRPNRRRVGCGLAAAASAASALRPGEGEEDVVEARAGGARARRPRARPVDPPDDLREDPGAVVDREGDPAVTRVGAGAVAAEVAEERRAPPGARASATRRSTTSSPRRSFSSVDGPLGDDAAAVDDRDPVGEAVGLLEVLGGEEDRRPVRDGAPRRPPRARCATPGRGRSSARRGTGPPAGRRATRRGRGGGACRPSRCARDGRRRPTGRRPSSSSTARVRDSRPAQVEEAADELEVLAAGEVLVDRGVLAGEADRRADRVGLADDVVAGDGRAARVGAEERREDPDGGG